VIDGGLHLGEWGSLPCFWATASKEAGRFEMVGIGELEASISE
jgi:hypothetical protein